MKVKWLNDCTSSYQSFSFRKTRKFMFKKNLSMIDIDMMQLPSDTNTYLRVFFILASSHIDEEDKIFNSKILKISLNFFLFLLFGRLATLRMSRNQFSKNFFKYLFKFSHFILWAVLILITFCV